MRAVIGIVVLLLVLAWVGWVQFSSPDGDPTLRVDSDKVRQDTAEIVEKSKHVVERAAEEIDENLESEPEFETEPEPET
ncbi:hypothetical protein [Stieleria mannarensis]|uniref:hypothetical protein n=1 Tax=Stieleria mannarensis TaxID=2755585 RepID=UPI0016029CFA|nr:hypothetical protein [Rhodopirellula sp. JC639]